MKKYLFTIFIPTYLLLAGCSAADLQKVLSGLFNGLPQGSSLEGQAKNFIDALAGGTNYQQKDVNEKIMTGNMAMAYMDDQGKNALTNKQAQGQPSIVFNKEKGELMVGTPERSLTFTERNFESDPKEYTNSIMTFSNSEGQFKLIQADATDSLFVGLSKRNDSHADFYLRNTHVLSVKDGFYAFPAKKSNIVSPVDTIHRGAIVTEVSYTKDSSAISGQRVKYIGDYLAVDLKAIKSNILTDKVNVWLTLNSAGGSKNEIVSEISMKIGKAEFYSRAYHDVSSQEVLFLTSEDSKSIDKWPTPPAGATSVTAGATSVTDDFNYEMFVNGRTLGSKGDSKNVPLAMLGRFSVKTGSNFYAGVFATGLARAEKGDTAIRTLGELFPNNPAAKANSCVSLQLGFADACGS